MEKNKKEIPVLLVTGYLGSGKTTLLNRLLNNRKGIRFAVIVNDIGEVNIDASLIARDGLSEAQADSLVPLQNGCICCTLKMDLVEQLADLMDGDRFDYIVIEASGICEPEPIAQTICSMPTMGPIVNRNGSPRLDCIVTVVDALRMKTDFGNGKALTPGTYGDEDLANLVAQQIEFCNIVILNKISEVSEEEAKLLEETIHALNPAVKIIKADYAEVDFDELLDTHTFDFEKTVTSATWVKEIEKPAEASEHHEHHDEHHNHDEAHHEHICEHHEHENHHAHSHEHCHHHHHGEGEVEEYGIGTFVYYRRKPFDINRFDYFVYKKWPATVIRAKGVLYFSNNMDMSFLFEQAGVQKKITEAGRWYATAPAEELEILAARDPELLRDWDDEYGDRMIKLVFIGRNMDRKAIEAALDDCLAK